LKRGFVDTPDGQIHYRSAGDGPPVVVLHPTPASSKSLIPVVEALAARGMRGIGMDTIGFGDSDRPNPPFDSQSQYAQSVVNLITGLGYEKANLIGVLTGSQIALQTAAEHPDRIETLIVQEPFNWGTPERRAIHEKLHRYHPRTPDGSYLIELWNRVPVRNDLKTHEDRFKEFLAVNDTEGAEVYGTMGWEGAATWSMCRVDIWEVTPRIQVPTLVLYGEGSPRHRALERFLETLPRSKGARDVPMYSSNPGGFADLVVEFIKNPGV
jgi:pimeloyl-ACP methyl ester carboxylesterase